MKSILKKLLVALPLIQLAALEAAAQPTENQINNFIAAMSEYSRVFVVFNIEYERSNERNHDSAMASIYSADANDIKEASEHLRDLVEIHNISGDCHAVNTRVRSKIHRSAKRVRSKLSAQLVGKDIHMPRFKVPHFYKMAENFYTDLERMDALMEFDTIKTSKESTD